MNTKKYLSLDESNNGKYIIVKIPRRTLRGNKTDPSSLFSDQQSYRRTMQVAGYIIVFLIGLIVGSIFHDRILTVNSDHAIWKTLTISAKPH